MIALNGGYGPKPAFSKRTERQLSPPFSRRHSAWRRPQALSSSIPEAGPMQVLQNDPAVIHLSSGDFDERHLLIVGTELDPL